jgi:hypothetical protein
MQNVNYVAKILANRIFAKNVLIYLYFLTLLKTFIMGCQLKNFPPIYFHIYSKGIAQPFERGGGRGGETRRIRFAVKY